MFNVETVVNGYGFGFGFAKPIDQVNIYYFACYCRLHFLFIQLTHFWQLRKTNVIDTVSKFLYFLVGFFIFVEIRVRHQRLGELLEALTCYKRSTQTDILPIKKYRCKSLCRAF